MRKREYACLLVAVFAVAFGATVLAVSGNPRSFDFHDHVARTLEEAETILIAKDTIRWDGFWRDVLLLINRERILPIRVWGRPEGAKTEALITLEFPKENRIVVEPGSEMEKKLLALLSKAKINSWLPSGLKNQLCEQIANRRARILPIDKP